MKKTKKIRLNLYLEKDTVQFAKAWSYVIQKPISGMLEDFLKRQEETVTTVTPFQWLSDPRINPELPPEDSHFRELDDYLKNREEEEFCKQNPDHPRAKLRRALVREHREYIQNKMEKQKAEEKELIRRWMEVFRTK